MSATMAATEPKSRVGFMSSDIRIVREYPHARAKVWRALTEPALMALWGMRPEGFAPVVGTRFKLVGTPNRGWRGYVECEVTDARAPSTIAYSWIDNDGTAARLTRYTLEDTAQGTRLTLEHTGFGGFGGFLLSKLVMAPGMLQAVNVNIPRVLDDIADDGSLKPGSTLKPKF